MSAMEHECPVCYAPVGSPCRVNPRVKVTFGDRFRWNPHEQRVFLASNDDPREVLS